MNLNKSTLVRIGAYNSTWLGGRGSKRFVQTSDGGRILIQKHPDLADTVITIFAIAKANEEVSEEQLTRLSYCHPLFIVIPYNIVGPKLFSMLSLIRRRWEEKRRYVDCQDKRYILREGYRIEVVYDVGKDTSTGETRYCSYPFDDEWKIAKSVEDRLLPGTRSDLNPYSLTIRSLRIRDVRIALKEEGLAVLQNRGNTLREINKYLKGAKRRRIRDKLHFEELNDEQRKAVVATVWDSFGKGLSPEEVKSITLANHNICGCEILDELIDNSAEIPTDEINNWREIRDKL
ncbi:hypothetical protein ACFLT3_02195 [Chloroflexota bacterium]